VISITGEPEKAEYIRSLGCHDTIDRMSDGIDIYFDNVGGKIAKTCNTHMSANGRVVNIGRISELLEMEPSDLVDYLTSLGDSGNERAFFIYHHQARFSEAERDLADWICAGKLKVVEDIAEGFELMPAALAGLYEGKNMGIQSCHVADPEPL
jgi:hypothetical protein